MACACPPNPRNEHDTCAECLAETTRIDDANHTEWDKERR